MAWEIKVTEHAAKQIGKLGASEARRVTDYLRSHVSQLEHPRKLGKPLRGSDLGTFWRYRVGNYRILCEINDAELTVLVVEVGHRRKVYR